MSQLNKDRHAVLQDELSRQHDKLLAALREAVESESFPEPGGDLRILTIEDLSAPHPGRIRSSIWAALW